MNKYKIVSKKGEGTFSEVLKVQGPNNTFYAMKRMKSRFESTEQVTNLREIQAIQRLSPHPQIVKLIEIIFDKKSGTLYLVFELMDHNLYELIKGRKQALPESQVKGLMYQALKGLDHMHRNGIFHRDIKPENMMIRGSDRLKLCDFGSCRGIRSRQPYTEYISTRWYRAPECLLTDGYYGYKMDIWGIGCVWFEITSLFPLFPGSNELDQIQKIHNILGTPPRELLEKFRKHSTHMNVTFPDQRGSGLARLLPGMNPEAADLLSKMLAYNPDERISAKSALTHPYFRELVEQDRLLREGVNIISTVSTPSVSSNALKARIATQTNLPQHNKPSNLGQSSLVPINPKTQNLTLPQQKTYESSLPQVSSSIKNEAVIGTTKKENENSDAKRKEVIPIKSSLTKTVYNKYAHIGPKYSLSQKKEAFLPTLSGGYGTKTFPKMSHNSGW